jgi:hypothetical protein
MFEPRDKLWLDIRRFVQGEWPPLDFCEDSDRPAKTQAIKVGGTHVTPLRFSNHFTADDLGLY